MQRFAFCITRVGVALRGTTNSATFLQHLPGEARTYQQLASILS
jgi:hypothetical protein